MRVRDLLSILNSMTVYGPTITKRICDEIAGGKSLARLCKEADWMPEEKTVYRWMWDHPEFLKAYDIAKEKQMEVYANQIIDLTDDCPRDADAVAKAKLQVYARQWVMGKLKPKKYGERTTIAGDKDNPLTINLAAVLDERIAAAAAHKTIDHEPAEALILPVIDIDMAEAD